MDLGNLSNLKGSNNRENGLYSKLLFQENFYCTISVEIIILSAYALL